MPTSDIDKDPRFREAVEHVRQADQLVSELAKERNRTIGGIRRLLLLRTGLLESRRNPRRSISQYHPKGLHAARERVNLIYGDWNQLEYDSSNLTITSEDRGEQILTYQQDLLMYAFATHQNEPLTFAQLLRIGEWPLVASTVNLSFAIGGLRQKADENVLLPNEKPKRNQWKYIKGVYRVGYVFKPQGL